MGNDRRKNDLQRVAEKKRSDINPLAILDKIDGMLKRANQLKNNYLIETISQLRKEAVKHNTDKGILREIYAKLSVQEGRLIDAERNVYQRGITQQKIR